MKTPIEVRRGALLGWSIVTCTSEICAFRNECSTHQSADLQRKDHGFTPELKVETKTEGSCKTADQPPVPFYGEELPLGYRNLGKGFVNIKDLN